MSKDSLKSRGKALEDSFFQERDRQLLESLRAEAAAKEKRESLSIASGVANDAVLDALLASEIEGETLAALSLFPLVAVAWADGNIAGQERNAILSAARDDGLKADDASYQLLEHWLDEQPGDHLLESWKSYVEALCKSLGDEATQSLKAEILGRARRVAEAAGGILGLGNKVSAAETAVLDDLQNAFG